jgi:hypothetical protein
MPRNIQDASLTSVKALPAAGASASQTGIDLGQITADCINEHVDVLLTTPAVPALVDAKTIIYTFEDSADNATFAAIPELATVTSLGAGGAGAAAVSRRVKLPPSTRRYLRVSATVLAAGGDNTAVSFTTKVLN